MLVTFETQVFANITMFGDVAVTLLKLMGHSGTVPSAIKAEDIPAALERLEKAIAAEKAATAAQTFRPNVDEEDENAVSLPHCAVPLIQLLEAAAEADCDVIWYS